MVTDAVTVGVEAGIPQNHSPPVICHLAIHLMDHKTMYQCSGMEKHNNGDVTNKIFGVYTSQLWEVFKRYDLGQNKLPITSLRAAFNELSLFPSNSQILEMVHCAVEYGSPCVANHITFGEFCVLVVELQHHYEKAPPLPPPKSLLKRRGETSERRRRKESSANFQVFLGGSCNPTTWRHDIAIPHFKKHAITFYNPVNNWRPELIELEDRAKQAATLLFFVIDNQTRAVVSMVEVAYLNGCHRQTVVVFNNYNWEWLEMQGNMLSQREKSDLIRARNVLMDIVERNGVPIFDNIQKGLDCATTVVKQSIRVQDLTAIHGAQPVLYGHTQAGEALLKLRETFNSVTGNAEGKIIKDDVCLGYKCYSGQELSIQWLQQQRRSQNSFTFEEFCCIVTEFRKKKPSPLTTLLTRLLYPVTWILGKLRPPEELPEADDTRDIYLGGSCGESSWRDEIAIPLLKRHGLSYMNPHVTDWMARLIPMQVALRERCRLLLYIFTENTRGLAAMVEAGYYIGLGCRVVLCMQKLKQGTVIAGEELTEEALCDYNRGRMYLSDMASRQGVAVFESTVDAVNSAISQLREQAASR
ncbi:uncharacterized protein LOC121384307 isoform X2 [Gigantopelta aegis]|uniref:uncharacterized protein LOC121384307 isoform X2 n=1 Tax=Gigantopelta aegis TaxID=1735272 RepID=UPI001B88D335|nr:uncharacterized protein LOC121384307 isoform X2 [Gigantopelta aegis]